MRVLSGRTKAFNLSFYPYSIKEWCAFIKEIRNIISLNKFKEIILSFIRLLKTTQFLHNTWQQRYQTTHASKITLYILLQDAFKYLSKSLILAFSQSTIYGLLIIKKWKFSIGPIFLWHHNVNECKGDFCHF